MPNNNYRNRKKSGSSRNSRYTNTRKSRSKVEADEPKAIKKMKQQTAKEREQLYRKSPNQKRKKKSKHPKLVATLKVTTIIFLLLCIIGAGIIAGTFFGLFGDDFEITKEELTIATANSVVVDQQGNKITELSGDEKRQIVTLEEMADYLPKAYVAIEDERFYKHSGVDFKRTAGAIIGTIFKNSSYGGSTITQQLVKNITKDDERSGLAGIMRKVKEWAKAYQVERMISKDQILELYLNILYVGGNVHGVELGSQYYFAKSAKDLDLAECAFMAGINNSPSNYSPYDTSTDNTEKIKNRTKTVLAKMKELGYIENEEEYNAAVDKVDAGLTFTQGQIASNNIYSYHTDAMITQLVNQIMEEKGISKELAENYVYGSGLKIYSTVDANVQARLEEEFKKDKYISKGRAKKSDGTLLNEHSEAGMAVIDYKTGNVVGVAGGLGEKTEARGWNRATQMQKQTGSSMKPLASVAPGLEEKVITAATVYDDNATDFGGGYTPKNYNGFKGIVNIRQFIETSQNIPALKIMAELKPEKSLEYLKKMGITTLNEEDEVLSLAIGGMKNGVSPLEMASAYGTIANGGIHITPTFYTKVEDANGNVVLTPKQEKERAISEQNAYITSSILQEPVNGAHGTATYCAIPGMDVAAKTGTTDNSCDRWLCGFSPYYSAACWYGYDENEEVTNGNNPAGLLWDAVMTDIHKSLQNAKFQRPSGIVEETACRDSGCIASSGCSNKYTEIFTKDNLPENCEGHGTQKICTVTGLIATPYCPETKNNVYGGAVPKENTKLWKPLKGTSASGERVTGTCNVHTAPVQEEKPKETTNTTTTPKPSPSPTTPSEPATPTPAGSSPKPEGGEE